jgi:hypothetical protein
MIGTSNHKKKGTSDTDFKILAVTIGDDELAVIESKLGEAVVVTRGDAATAEHSSAT